MKIKYDNSADEWRGLLNDPKRLERSETWFRSDRVDSWRHMRMRSHLNAVIKYARDKKWITIGDGRYGTDANYLIAQGIRDVHATDMVDDLLKVAAERGFINSYSAENAEMLSFEDEHFDYVYCKETYHHLPRPYVAVYEMLRISKEAIIMTEPNDQYMNANVLFMAMKRLLRRSVGGHYFEPVGNYIYSVSEREIKKLMLGVGLRYCAFKGLNDHYIDGVEDVPIVGGTLPQRIIRLRVRFRIFVRDLLCKVGLMTPNMVTAILFKTRPEAKVVNELKAQGFKVEALPVNPYS